jgi:anthranilate phosphoribosyltransferase
VKKHEDVVVIESFVQRVQRGIDLSMQDMSRAIDRIMQGEVPQDQTASLLIGLREKGETVSEIAGAADAMRKNMTRIRTHRTGLVDVVGTGGDGSGTFNISTAAALVTAAAGVPVAKHGNRGMTSKSGSADVLAELGVNIDATLEQVERCLDQLGICFCFAPLFHRSMKHVGPVRKRIEGPTIFNWLGPLCNPASAPFQLLGVGRPEMRPVLAEALSMLGTERAMVVCGDDGLDEVSLTETTRVTAVEGAQLRQFAWTPEDFGLSRAPRTSMLIDCPAASARIIRDILAGKPGPPRDIVVLNAAAALHTASPDQQPQDCARLAAEAIDNGTVGDLLARLVEVSNA